MSLLPCLIALGIALAPAAAGQAPEALPPPAQSAPEVTPALDLEQAAALGVERLLALQERYLPDEPVPRLPADQLAAWQQKERDRLARARAAAGELCNEWPYEGVYRVGREIPAGYRVGGSAIVCLALLETPGYRADPARQAAVERAVDFILSMLAQDPALETGRKRGYDVRGWGFVYALELCLALRRAQVLDPERSERIEAAVGDLLVRLADNQTEAGGWNYADDRRHSPFQTGVTLLTLLQARSQGFEVAPALIERALEALDSGRNPETGAFAYSGPGSEPMHASAARAALAELCLFEAGRSSVADLERAILGFFDGYAHLLARKSRQGTHEGPFGIAPYYFYFGHTYAARAIEALPEARRAGHRERLRALLQSTREPDGTWNDRIFPRSAAYGTAMALRALFAAEPPLEPPAPSAE
jgi:hypothetical protein